MKNKIKLRPSDPHPRFKRILYLRLIYWLSNKLVRTKPEFLYSYRFSNESLPPENEELDIITIAFNNLAVLQYQYKSLSEHLKDKEYHYLIADNSSNKKTSQAILKFCQQENISYIRLPKSRLLDAWSGSYSHGAALNWIYYQYISPRNPKYFGFLDHDIYLIKPIEIKKEMETQQFYAHRGGKENNYKFWYFWPGLMFFKADFLQDVQTNFLPCRASGFYLDTGGSMWFALYSKLDTDSLHFIDCEVCHLKELGYDTDINVGFMDDCWLHSGNAGYGKKDWKNYEYIVGEVLKKYIPL